MASSSAKKRVQVSEDLIDWFELDYEHLVPNWKHTRIVHTDANGIDWISDIDSRKRLFAMLSVR